MPDLTAQPKSNGADSGDAALRSMIGTLGAQLPTAIKNQQADIAEADKNVAAAKASVSEAEEHYGALEDVMQQQYDAALTHANDMAQRQRSLSLDITKGIWKFAPIAVAFGLLAGKETGGNVASGVSVMMQGLAGYANGRLNQYNAAYQQFGDAVKDAQDQVKDTIDRAKEIMGDAKVDLNTRIRQLQLETRDDSLIHKAAMSNDPEKIIKAVTDLEQAQDRLQKLWKPLSSKASTSFPPELKTMAAQAVTSLMPPPQMPKGMLGESSAMQSTDPKFATWKEQMATWKTRTAGLEFQLAQRAQINMADGYSMNDAMNMAIGYFTARRLLSPGSVDFAGQTYNFQGPATTPAAPAGNAVEIGGKTYSRDAIAAGAKKAGMSVDDYIARAKAYAAKNRT